MIKIYKFIVNVIFVIIIALLLMYIMLRVTDKIEIYKVKTGSMEEQIHIGDYILIFRKGSYSVGDIVTYTSNDGFITHRIIRKDGNRVITKGDANNSEDREIVESTIVGKVIISGGILNTVINYKYAIVSVLLSLYFFSCYFGNNKNSKKTEQDSINDIKEENDINKLVVDEVDKNVENNEITLEKDEVKKEDNIEENEEKTELHETEKEDRIDNTEVLNNKLEKDSNIDEKSETKEIDIKKKDEKKE